MRTTNLLLISLFAGLLNTADAAESASAVTEVPQVATHHKHHAQKDCVEKPGKPCHLHKHEAASRVATPANEPATLKTVAPVSAVSIAPAAPVVAGNKVAGILSDSEGRALAQKSGCFTCHAIDKKVVGPAWKDVAAKYRGDSSMEAKLVAKVSKGGSGVWGSTPMPANSPRVKDADIQALVKFVLSLK